MAGDNDNVIETDVVRIYPDLSGFRRKLERDLNKQLAGVRGTIPVELETKTADFQKAANYVAGLRNKYNREQEKANKAAAASDDAALGNTLKNLGRRFDLQANGAKATAKFYTDQSKAAKDAADKEEEALGRSIKAIGRRFDLQRAGTKATQQFYADEAAAADRAAKETIKSNVSRQRSDETFANFQARVNSELKAIRQAGAQDEISIHHQTAGAVAAIEKEASRLRIATLTADEKLEAESNRRSAASAKAAAASKKLLNENLIKSSKLINFGGEGVKPMNLLYTAVAAVTPALFALGSSAVEASASLAALGAAGIGAALGIGGILVAFQGIGDALKLRTQVQNEAAQASDNAVTSQRELNSALRDQKTAEADVHKARQEAIRDLQDLKRAVIDLDNQYNDDKLSVAEAKDNEAATNRNFFATTLEKRRATQDRVNAETKLGDTGLQRKEKREDLKTSLSKGIEKSDKVVAAKEKVRDAGDRVAAAKVAGGVGKTSSAASQLKQKLADMAPAARDIYYWFDKNETSLKNTKKSLQQAILPGFYKFLTAINTKPKGGGKTTIQLAAEYAGQLGGIISKYAGKIGTFSKSPLFRSKLKIIQGINVKAFEKLGDAALTLLKPLLRITEKAAPGFLIFAGYVDKLATKFDKFISKADKDGSLKKFFDDSRKSAKTWYGIIKDAVEIVFGLFKASVPSGNSLADRVKSFLDEINNNVNSPAGQKAISDFFDKLTHLPYGKIATFFVNATAFFAAFRTYKFLFGLNPFFQAIGAIAAADPTAFAEAASSLGTALGNIAKFVAENPTLLTTLLTVFAAAKVGKAIGFDIKIPAVNALKDALTSKFKILDKFIGGGATTATMNVTAGVVNINGSIPGTGTNGTPVAAPTPGEKAAPKPGEPAPKNVTSTGAKRPFNGAGEFLFVDIPDPTRADIDKLNRAAIAKDPTLLARYPALATMYPDLAAKAGPKAIGTPVKAPNRKSGGGTFTYDTPKLINDEKVGYDRLKSNLETFGRKSPITKDSIDNYIDVRKKRVEEYVSYIRSTQGPVAAAKVQQTEDKKSADKLKDLLVKYGANKTAAKLYADQVFNVTETSKKSKTAVDKEAVSFDSMGNSLKDTTTKAELLNKKSETLAGTVNGLVGDHVIALSTKNYAAVKKQLDLLYATQHVLYNPTYSNSAAGADTVSSQNQFLDPKTGLPKVYAAKADGGYIRGPGTATSDSIPARLSNGEYVMPTKVVQHYGVGLMDAIRQRAVPGFAAGGPVGTIPMKVNLPTKGFQFPEATPLVDAGTGVASGDSSVAEIAEATARAMGATTKQLVALIEAGLVESGLHNINFGDRDSLGFLQQRASWGSASSRLNVATATRKFISKARRLDNAELNAGQLAAAVQVPRRDLRYKYGAREADAIAVINRQAPFLAGYGGNIGQQTGGGFDTKAGLIAFGHWLQARGYTVSENPAFGGVGRHAENSQHYRGNAIDVNHGAGTSAREQAYLAKIIPEAHRRGFRTIFMAPGHYNHAHIDLGPGHAKGGAVVNKYDNGGVLPPGYSQVFNGTGKNETVRTDKQEKELNKAVRIDPRDLSSLAAMFGGGGTSSVNLDGRKVAELTNRYNYLPAGV